MDGHLVTRLDVPLLSFLVVTAGNILTGHNGSSTYMFRQLIKKSFSGTLEIAPKITNIETKNLTVEI